MKAALRGELGTEDPVRLVQFALTCGVQTFTIGSPTAEMLDALSLFQIGLQRVQDSRHPRLRYANQTVWRLTLDSIGVFAELHAASVEHGTSWTFLRSGTVFLSFSLKSVWLQIAQAQWEELFRLGFRFSLFKPDGTPYKENFGAADLPENKRRLTSGTMSKPKTVAEVIAAPFGIQSHPPTYGSRRPNLALLRNDRISCWWTTSHDEILEAQIAKDGWRWWPSKSGLVSITDRDMFERWKREDPECLKRGGWGEILVEYARARADSIGLTSTMRWPEDATACSICGDRFSPSLHHRNIRRASHFFDRLCYTCIQDAYNSRDASATREHILNYAKELADLLGRIPNASFGCSHKDYGLLTEANYTNIVRLLWKRPADERIKAESRSWLQTLIDCGVLEDGTRRLSRGTQCMALDGHVCLSLAEKTIDDMLTELGIKHQKESFYPEGRFRCDFLAGSTYIEYFGLRGNPEYDVRIQEKLNLCQRLGLSLFVIYPEDLLDSSALRRRLQGIQWTPGSAP